MITNISEEDKIKNSSDISSNYDKHTIVFSKMMNGKKGIKYQDLKIFFSVIEMNRNKKQRGIK